MIENVPLTIDVFDAAVGRSGHVQAVFFRSALVSHIAVGNDRAAKDKVTVGIVAGGIAQLVVLPGGIDEVILFAYLADRACLKERMRRKAGAGDICRDNVSRLAGDSHHVVAYGNCAGSHHTALGVQNFVAALVIALHNGLDQIFLVPEILVQLFVRPCAVVDADGAVVVDNARVKADILQHRAAVRIADETQIAERTSRRVTDSHADRTVVAAEAGSAGHTIIKVESAVVALYHIRGIHEFAVCGVCRILVGTIDRTLTAPVGKVGHRCRICGVVQHTEGLAAFFVV